MRRSKLEKNIQETGGKDIAFNNILRTMNESGQFKASFLVDVQGMLVASVSNGEDTDAAGAMAAQLHEMVEQTQSRIHLGGAEEVSRALQRPHAPRQPLFQAGRADPDPGRRNDPRANVS